MKRHGITALLSLMFLMMLCIPAHAEGEIAFVTDEAGVFTEDEWAELESMAQSAADEYSFGIYAVILEDFQDYVNTSDAYEAAKAIYTANNMGIGPDADGVMLMLSMAERDYALIAHGYGNTAITDYGNDYLESIFLDNFRENDWYGGIYDYISEAEGLVDSAVNGDIFDIAGTGYNKYEEENEINWTIGIVGGLAAGFGIAFLVRMILMNQLKSVYHGTEAAAYVPDDGINITKSRDYYTHTTETRVYNPPKSNNNRSGSGGGTSVDSDGFSGSSGKF